MLRRCSTLPVLSQREQARFERFAQRYFKVHPERRAGVLLDWADAESYRKELGATQCNVAPRLYADHWAQFVALCRAEPSGDVLGDVEVTGEGYVRMPVNGFGLRGMSHEFKQGSAVARLPCVWHRMLLEPGEVLENAAPWAWPCARSDWGTVTGVALVGQGIEQNSGPAYWLAYMPLRAPVTASAGATFTLPAGAFRLRFNLDDRIGRGANSAIPNDLKYIVGAFGDRPQDTAAFRAHRAAVR